MNLSNTTAIKILLFHCFFLLGNSSILACNSDFLEIFHELSSEGPYCDGDEITIKVAGAYVGGGISSDISDNLSASSSLSYDFEYINENFYQEQVRIILDKDRGNSIKFKYNFHILGNDYEDDCQCSTEKTIYFEIDEVVQPSNADQLKIEWREGDTLSLLHYTGDYCLEWGKIEGGNEVIIPGEVSNYLVPNASSSSIFVDTVINCVPIPKDQFEEIYFVSIGNCISEPGQCNLKIYFTPEEFYYKIYPAVEPPIGEQFKIEWREGDTLSLLNYTDDYCLEWGKFEDGNETIIPGENDKYLATNTSSKSIFVDTVINCVPIPKDQFEDIYFVSIENCISESEQCNLKIYFIPEEFNYKELTIETNLSYSSMVYPNPGNGVLTIECSTFSDDQSVHFEIISQNGELALAQKLDNALGYGTLDFANYSPGLYFIVIYINNRQESIQRYIKN